MDRLYKVPFANDPDRYVLVSAKELHNLYWGDYLSSNLDLDTFMSIKDPDWPLG